MNRPRHQRGMATLLIILLTGLAVAVASLSGLNALNSSRQRLLTTHAQTAAQGAAWRGVEVVRQLLLQADLTSHAVDCSNGAYNGTSFDLMTDNQVALSALNLRQARLIRICKNGTTDYRVTAQVTGQAGEERDSGPLATATVEVVYEIAINKSGESQACPDSQGIGGMSIYRSMEQGGNVTIKSNQGSSLAVYIKGNVSGGATFDMPDMTLKVDGAINLIDGNVKAKVIQANEDIYLSGTVNAEQVLSRGNITIASNSSNPMQLVQANKNITIANSQNIIAVKGKGNLSVTNSPVIGTVLLEGNINWSGSGSATSVQAKGRLSVTGSPKLETALIVGNIDWSGSGTATSIKGSGAVNWTNGAATTITAADNVYYGGWSGATIHSGGTVTFSADWLKQQSQVYEHESVLIPDVPDVSEVPAVAVAQPKVDVATLEVLSNYAFHYDTTKKLIKVSVRNINGLAESDPTDFYLFKYNQIIQHQYWTETKVMGDDYLCPADKIVQQNGSTSCNITPPARLCGKDAYNGSCFSYSSGKWGLTGVGEVTAPGILWFDGNLSLAESGTSPYFVNTLMATGAITASGSGSVIYAPAFAGYDVVCNNETPANLPDEYKNKKVTANSVFNSLYPTNLCGEGKLNDNALSNVALIAGSYADDESYIGGNIFIEKGTIVWGNVMAGNIFDAKNGDIYIHGSILAANLSNGSDSVSLTSKVTLDFTDIPESGDISVQPCELDGSCVCSGTSSDSDINAAVYWSRYL